MGEQAFHMNTDFALIAQLSVYFCIQKAVLLMSLIVFGLRKNSAKRITAARLQWKG